MKTIEIKPVREIKIWLSLFVIGNFINVSSILAYDTSWKELYTQIDFVFFISCFLYFAAVVIRVIINFLKK
jgi:hypothetical protein